MVLVALLAELADLATFRPASEANPLVVAAGPYAVALKLLVMVVIAAGWLAYRAKWKPVMAVAILAGLLGTWSNL